MSLLEWAAALTGFVSVWLTVRQNVWCWPTGLVNVALYVIVFWQARLYADMGLQVFYAAASVYGWWAWLHGGAGGVELRVTRAPWAWLLGLLTAGAAVAFGLGLALHALTDASLPWLDSALTALSLVAQVLMTRKWIENWLLWIGVDVVYVGMYVYKGLYPTALLYAAFLGLAVLGWRAWRAALRRGAQAGASLLRVVVTGSECTGKTTLTVELARHFECSWVPEHARAYADRRGAPLGPEDVEPIARGQVGDEQRGARDAQALLLLDTDLVSTLVYARHYYGACPAWIERAARERRADLYLLLHPDVPWLADGVRDRGDRRAEMHALFEAALQELGCRVAHVRGDWDARRGAAQRAVQELVAAQPGSRSAD